MFRIFAADAFALVEVLLIGSGEPGASSFVDTEAVERDRDLNVRFKDIQNGGDTRKTPLSDWRCDERKLIHKGATFELPEEYEKAF